MREVCRPRLLPALLAAVVLSALCAAPAPAQRASPRIIGGGSASITDYPYQVRLTIQSNAITEGQCGGSIRDATHILTAAHCVTDDMVLLRQATAPGNLTVWFGSADRASQTSASVASVTVAPQYLNLDDNYDAALLTLAQPLPGYGGPNVNRAPFAGAGELSAAVNAGEMATATGFGVTSSLPGSPTSPSMRVVSLPLRDDSACSAYYGSGFSPRLAVCAGGVGGSDTCQGDSGGPLVITVGGVRKLVGLTSRGDGCGQDGVPAVYTETSSPEICALLGGGAECTTSPPPATPRAAGDTVRPTARLTSLRCRKRTCSFRVRAADQGGGVRTLSARFYRRVRICRAGDGRRSCRTVLRNRKVKTTKIPGGYSGKAKLKVARYRLDAVATDAAGNRSKVARKRFTVKKR